MSAVRSEPPSDSHRQDVRLAVEAAARAEAQALRAYRQAMLFSLRAASAHDHAALVAGEVGMSAQATLHEGLAVRARDAARVVIALDGDEHRDAAGA